MRGPGSYGRNDAGDAALEAAFLSREVGRPVRLQYSRAQGTGWDPKGPASVHLCKGGLDADGSVVGLEILNRGREADIARIYAGEADAQDLLERYAVDYVVVSPIERAMLTVNDAFFEAFPLVAEAGQYRLYEVP
jgi:hypothetical protein